MSQHRSDLHILLNFSIYFPDIFTEIGGMIENIFFPIDLMHNQCQNFLILSHFSECFDVPAGCARGSNPGFETRDTNVTGSPKEQCP